MRGLNHPGVPTTEFVPRPGRFDYAGAQWGISIRLVDGRTDSIEVFEPDDTFVGGQPFAWHIEPGTGVQYGRAVHPFYGSIAIARAVPLS